MASTAEASFQTMWTEAEIRFQEKTEMRLRSSKLSLDDILAQWDARHSKGEPKSQNKKAKVRELLKNVLLAFKVLGGVVAQGTSQVFFPAQLCFNAVGFLIDIPSRIHELYDDLEQLFEKVYNFQQQFQIYRTYEQYADVDKKFKNATHNVMICFVDICALSIRILGSGQWSRLKSVGEKALFDSDSGVGDLMVKFESLVSQQSRITNAVTLRHVLKAASESDMSMRALLDRLQADSDKNDQMLEGIGQILTSTNEQKAERTRQYQIKKIMKKLDFKEKAIEALNVSWEQMRDDSVEEGGEWLWEIPEYDQWVNLESSTGFSLVLTGESGTGKSYLSSAIVQQLRSQDSNDSSGYFRVLVAHYRFPPENTKVDRDDDAVKQPHLPTTALKAMAIQLAQQEPTYAKLLKSFLDRQNSSFFKDSTCKGLSSMLELFASRRESRIFLVFDGFDQISYEDSCQLFASLENMVQWGLRIVVTGTVKAFDNSGTDPSTMELRDLTLERLPEIAKGDFSSVERRLRRIEKAIFSPEEIKALLRDDIANDQRLLAQGLLDSLNTSLNNHEIKLLNVLLVWAIYGRLCFGMADLEAAWYLQSQSPLPQPLEKFIKGKYAKIFKIDVGWIGVDEPVEDMMRASEASNIRGNDDEQDEATITLNITINRAGISRVRRFLWDLAGAATFDRFPFDSATYIERQIRVGASPAEGQLMITKACLRILLQDPDSKTAPLVPYALSYFCEHLGRLRELKNSRGIQPIEVEEIGRDLIDLFHADTGNLRLHWNQSYDSDFPFLVDEQFVAIWEWFEDLSVTRLPRKELLWLKQITAEGNRKVDVLKDVAVMVSRRWLCEEDAYCISNYKWLDQFLDIAAETCADNRVDPSPGSNTGMSEAQIEQINQTDQLSRPSSVSKRSLSTKERILRALEWAKEVGGCVDENSCWFTRLGLTFLDGDETTDAIDTFKRAKSLPDWTWMTSQGLALAYSESSTHKAILEIDNALDILRKQPRWKDLDDEELVYNLKLKAEWCIDLDHTETSIELFREILQYNAEDYESVSRLLLLLTNAAKLQEVHTWVENMSKQTLEDGNLTRLANLFLQTSASDFECFELTLRAVRQSRAFDLVLKNMESAIEHAQLNRMTVALAPLLLHYGIAAATYKPSWIGIAPEHWQECLSQPYELSNDDCLDKATMLLATYHFDQAILAKEADQDPEDHLNELRQLDKKFKGDWYRSGRSVLASYYSRTGSVEKAQSLLLHDMKNGVDLLSDDTPENDWWGYRQIGSCCMNTDDDVNALSAFYLATYPPAEDQRNAPSEQSGNTTRCDGICGRRALIDYWTCKVCLNINFDEGCLEKLKKGTLGRYICSPQHQWLHEPSWTEERAAIGAGKVRVGGEMVNGERVGGEIIEAEEWLKQVKDKWSIEDIKLEGKNDATVETTQAQEETQLQQ